MIFYYWKKIILESKANVVFFFKFEMKNEKLSQICTHFEIAWV